VEWLFCIVIVKVLCGCDDGDARLLALDDFAELRLLLAADFTDDARVLTLASISDGWASDASRLLLAIFAENLLPYPLVSTD